MVPNWIIAFGLGVAGGVIRVLISRKWVWPHKLSTEDGGPGFEFGSVGTLLTAGSAGSLLWVPFTSHLFADQGFGRYTTVAAIFVGLGGGDILMTYLNKWLGVTATQQANQETGVILERQARSIDNLTQEVSDLRARERELQEEIDRLKKDDN
jgi:hypothetical protein